MGRGMTIDVAFDFGADAKGKNPDPDKDSPTLRLYHRLLWSKPLPVGHSSICRRRLEERTCTIARAWGSSHYRAIR
jgi:hypothetical protein